MLLQKFSKGLSEMDWNIPHIIYNERQNRYNGYTPGISGYILSHVKESHEELLILLLDEYDKVFFENRYYNRNDLRKLKINKILKKKINVL